MVFINVPAAGVAKAGDEKEKDEAGTAAAADPKPAGNAPNGQQEGKMPDIGLIARRLHARPDGGEPAGANS